MQNRESKYYSLFILNRAGTLLYYKNFSSSISQHSQNDLICLASTFHGLHAISNRGIGIFTDDDDIELSSGIVTLEAAGFRLQCFQSMTGVKFFVIAAPDTPHCEAVLHLVYELYTDYVLKNPFYRVEQPIRCELFDIHLDELIQEYSDTRDQKA